MKALWLFTHCVLHTRNVAELRGGVNYIIAEPLNIETFKLNGATSREWAYLHRTRRDGTSGNLGKLLRDFAEAYAAAVSKNLQQQNAHLIKEGLRVDADADKWMSRAAKAEKKVAELEKEITALRETK